MLLIYFALFLATGLPPAVSVCPTRTVTPSATGRVYSPGFSGDYNADLDCKLTLDVPSNKEVVVTYGHIDIECKYLSSSLTSGNNRLDVNQSRAKSTKNILNYLIVFN
jgi:hypothetical protein